MLRKNKISSRLVKKMLFVGGEPRSGTTALAHILRASPEVVLGTERYQKLWKTDQVRQELFEKERFLRLDDEPVGADNSDYLVKINAANGFNHAKFVGDKVVNMSKNLEKIFRHFSAPVCLMIIRNPLSVMQSNQARTDNPNDRYSVDAEAALRRWNNSNRVVSDHIASGAPVSVVAYERLFSSRKAIAILFEKLGISKTGLDENAIEFYLSHAAELKNKVGPRGEEARWLASRYADFDTYRSLIDQHCIVKSTDKRDDRATLLQGVIS